MLRLLGRTDDDAADARRTADGARDPAGRRPLGPRPLPRRHRHLQPHHARRAARRWRRPSTGRRGSTALGGTDDELAEVLVRQPSYLAGAVRGPRPRCRSTTGRPGSPSTWSVGAAPYLSGAVRRGELRLLLPHPHRRRGACATAGSAASASCNGALGEAVGAEYVARTSRPRPRPRWTSWSPTWSRPTASASAGSTWMGEETRERALAKLDQFRPKIGYPDTLARLLAPSRSTATTCSATSAAASAFETDRQLAQARRAGRPRRVVHDARRRSTPTTTPASTRSASRPPSCSRRSSTPSADAAAQLRRHRRGDRPRDRPRLRRPGLAVRRRRQPRRTGGPTTTARSSRCCADKLIAQYDGFEPRELPGHHVNGALTVGENIGDLGGLTIAPARLRAQPRRRRGPGHRRPDRPRAAVPELGATSGASRPARSCAAPAAVGRPALAGRVPRQHRAQPRRVPRRVRHRARATASGSTPRTASASGSAAPAGERSGEGGGRARRAGRGAGACRSR